MRDRKSLRVALGLLVLLALPAAAFAMQSQPPSEAQTATPAETDVSLYQQILQSGDAASRLTLVEKFLATYPESPYMSRVLTAAIEAHLIRNELEKAVEYGEKALAIDPNNAVNLILVADSVSESAKPSQTDYQERLQRAEDYSKRALELVPTLYPPDRRDPSIPAAQYELQEDFAEARAHAILGYVYYRRNEMPAAETELKLATDLNQLRPDSADFERLGMVQVHQKKYDLARDSFQRCVDAAGFSSDNCQRRLEMLEQMVEQDKAKVAPKPQE